MAGLGQSGRDSAPGRESPSVESSRGLKTPGARGQRSAARVELTISPPLLAIIGRPVIRYRQCLTICMVSNSAELDARFHLEVARGRARGRARGGR